MTVVGRYKLVGVNGSLLPASIDPSGAGGDPRRCDLIGGELRLEQDGTYVLNLMTRHESVGGLRTISTGGTWRFLPSALDPTSGEIHLASGRGQISAAVTGVSLVHRTPSSDPGRGAKTHWVYIRQARMDGSAPGNLSASAPS